MTLVPFIPVLLLNREENFQGRVAGQIVQDGQEDGDSRLIVGAKDGFSRGGYVVSRRSGA
ncbi:MAG: hypothetical protein ACOX2G_05930 [Bacillota bacterium]